MELKNIPLRYQATIILEAKTPLVIGSGDKDLLLDNPIIRDAFDLPYIPATSLAGVLRHTLPLEKSILDSLFGYQEENGEKGEGSRLIFSSAHLLGENKAVADGLDMAMAKKMQDDINSWLVFPTRDHAHINHKGVADKTGHGKFDSELLMRGVRFVFDIELWGNDADKDNWQAILAAFASPLFRIGAGTRKGFGALDIIEVWHKTFDLRQPTELKNYLDKTTQIQIPTIAQGFTKAAITAAKSDKFFHYQLTLTPRDFFLFDGQFDEEATKQALKLAEAAKIKAEQEKKSTNDTWQKDIALKMPEKLADMTPKIEQILTWQADKPTLSNYKWLIPATSVKGAIAHRTAFHYNKLAGNFAKNESTDLLTEVQNYVAQLNTAGLSAEDTKVAQAKIAEYLAKLDGKEGYFDSFVGEENPAVKALFGTAAKEEKDEKTGKTEQIGQRGRVIFSDVYLAKPADTKIFNHVKIDRYTGGAIDTALFTEKVAATKEQFILDIFVEKAAFQEDEDEYIQTAFKQALADICNEQLPLGGGVMRGHGMMSGRFTIDDKPYKNQ